MRARTPRQFVVNSFSVRYQFIGLSVGLTDQLLDTECEKDTYYAMPKTPVPTIEDGSGARLSEKEFECDMFEVLVGKSLNSKRELTTRYTQVN